MMNAADEITYEDMMRDETNRNYAQHVLKLIGERPARQTLQIPIPMQVFGWTDAGKAVAAYLAPHCASIVIREPSSNDYACGLYYPYLNIVTK
jgi:hypothetical protein